jgi:hypothetical protein
MPPFKRGWAEAGFVQIGEKQALTRLAAELEAVIIVPKPFTTVEK